MPRTTEDRRDLRRQEIIEAALRCFVRNGMAGTSIVDITAEAGISTGLLYLHFRSKADLVRAAAQDALQRRVAALAASAAGPQPPSPDELITRLATTVDPAQARIAVQAWGEATTDPAMHDLVVMMSGRMRDLFQIHCELWFVTARGCPADQARTRAAAAADRLLATYQSLIIRSALLSTAG